MTETGPICRVWMWTELLSSSGADILVWIPKDSAAVMNSDKWMLVYNCWVVLCISRAVLSLPQHMSGDKRSRYAVVLIWLRLPVLLSSPSPLCGQLTFFSIMWQNPLNSQYKCHNALITRMHITRNSLWLSTLLLIRWNFSEHLDLL